MDTRGRLIAGSHNRNEFVLINADEIARVKDLKKTPFPFSSFLFLFCETPILLIRCHGTVYKLEFSDVRDVGTWGMHFFGFWFCC